MTCILIVTLIPAVDCAYHTKPILPIFLLLADYRVAIRNHLPGPVILESLCSIRRGRLYGTPIMEEQPMILLTILSAISMMAGCLQDQPLQPIFR
ncbi:hypothetical protein SDC9_101570 [bioreactor metagenome]|uniref:Uncharacterized protein n=1 Tax=bioreactor metagenome TaxID=1076179 RepID=A0A645ANW3_9ZZZZ